MQELTDVLGREHVQLEFLLFKILVLRDLLRSGDNRFLRWAGEEVLRASEQVRTTELTRQRRVHQLTVAHGLADDSDPSLALLAQQSPQPYKTIFEEHLTAIAGLVTEVQAVLRLTSTLAEARGHSVAGVLRQMHRPELARRSTGRHAKPSSMLLP